jgi:hypothetical protein
MLIAISLDMLLRFRRFEAVPGHGTLAACFRLTEAELLF